MTSQMSFFWTSAHHERCESPEQQTRCRFPGIFLCGWSRWSRSARESKSHRSRDA